MPADSPKVRRRNSDLHVRYGDGRREVVRNGATPRFDPPLTYGFGPDGGYTVEVKR